MIGDDRLRDGVIAQDLEKTHPEMVYENDKGFKQVAYTDYTLLKLAKKDQQIKELNERVDKLELLIKKFK
jgi:hypothetical protein